MRRAVGFGGEITLCCNYCCNWDPEHDMGGDMETDMLVSSIGLAGTCGPQEVTALVALLVHRYQKLDGFMPLSSHSMK